MPYSNERKFSYRKIPDWEDIELGDIDALSAYFMPLAESVARKHCYSIRFKDVDEYISVAYEHLPRLCEKLTSKTTAKGFIRSSLVGILKNWLRDNGRKIRLPRGILDNHSRINTYRKKHKNATDEEIKKALNLSEKQWSDCQEALSLDFTPLVETVPNREEPDQTFSNEFREKLSLIHDVSDEVFEEMYRIYVNGGKFINPKLKEEIETIIAKLNN